MEIQYRIFEIAVFDEFISHVRNFMLSDSERTRRLYRGHTETDWELLPKIGRKNYFKADLLKCEFDILDEFRCLAVQQNVDIKDYSEWDLIALAQHHGLPTRLLDWTSNPLAALWFAFQKDDCSTNERCVWSLEVDDSYFADINKSPFSQEKTAIFRPNHITKRITSQSGWFSNHKFVQETNSFVPLEKQSAYSWTLIKFIFDNRLRINILKTLELFGINHYSMFPDLDGLTSYIEWKRFRLTYMP
ncbi:MAG: FRG domain-containing protein [Bacteroidota bacterium]